MSQTVQPHGKAPVDRLVSVLLLVLMAAGSLALWIVVPAGILRLLLPLSESKGYHLAIGLLAVPAAMIAFGMSLTWLNGLYLRVNGAWRADDEDGYPRRVRGPLESLMIGSLLFALVAMAFWFFLLAENPSSQVI